MHTSRVTRDDKVRVSCEKVAEEGGFGGYLRRGIAVAFSRGGSGGCAWPDAADLEEATGLRRGSGRLRFEAVAPAPFAATTWRAGFRRWRLGRRESWRGDTDGATVIVVVKWIDGGVWAKYGGNSAHGEARVHRVQ
ncbi:hypothetical protein CASFOL_005436 [Castilleja foliolosa]|uniref:Uncharacterized protein n=1 Tax=Castilleja foliolosa TaxID=1961234 RepID=A0ABD3E3G3_9LAMI